MDSEESKQTAQAGDLALLVGRDRKTFVLKLQPGVEIHTHRGIVSHDALIGMPWGHQLISHTGYPYSFFRPSTDDLVRDIKRTTQIVYPKDAGYILMKMGIAAGSQVIEAGSGSGGLTIIFARAVGSHGRVYSYDVREEVQTLARQNVEKLGLEGIVDFKLRDIKEGFDERGVDALFLDVHSPWYYLRQAHEALVGGGFLGCILPTMNQVIRLCEGLTKLDFGYVEVEELLLRSYKVVPARMRPMDRMIAHTGYLIFARALVPVKSK